MTCFLVLAVHALAAVSTHVASSIMVASSAVQTVAVTPHGVGIAFRRAVSARAGWMAWFWFALIFVFWKRYWSVFVADCVCGGVSVVWGLRVWRGLVAEETRLEE